jgi:hypothetical protein
MFVGAEHAGLAQESIDQGGFPMVNVSYNGKVSDIWSSHFVHGILKRGLEPRELYGRAPLFYSSRRGE